MDSTLVWRPAQGVETEIREALSLRWGVVPEALVLEWGQPREGTLPPGYDKVEIIGHGRDGRWVVSFRKTVGSRDAKPVLLRAGVQISRPVASRSLQRGEVIGEGDMEMESVTHWGSVEELPDPCALGWVAQRRIEVGEALTEPGVKPPLMVVSGSPVSALWSSGKVELKLQATAMGSGALGDRVYVRTQDGTRLDGVVEGPGLVVISNTLMEQGK